MSIIKLFFKLIKKVYIFTHKKEYLADIYDETITTIDRQNANNQIFKLLTSEQPCLISRLGTTELICINNYLSITSKENYIKKIYNYITDNTQPPWWNESFFKDMSHSSGIFPPSIETSVKFSERYLKDIPLIDLLGSFQYQEKFLPLRNDLIKVHLETLYPFFCRQPMDYGTSKQKSPSNSPF